MLRCVCLVLVALLVGCGKAKQPAAVPETNTGGATKIDAPKLRSVTLALNWFPEMEHGGFYAAQAAGYFAEEGLDVKIVPGGSQVPVIQNVARGEATFGVAAADQILLGRAKDAKVVALMAPLQTSPRCIMVHEESGITSFDQLENVTLAVRPGITFYKFLQKELPLKDVKVVNYSGNVAQFLLDKKSAQQAYVFSEPFVAQQQGARVRTLLVSELGYNPYTSLLFTRDELVTKDRELVDKMTRACVRGWQKYLDDPAPANELIRQVNTELSPEALSFGADAIKPLCLPEGAAPESLGRMTLERWHQLAEQLLAIGALEKGTDDAKHAFVPTDWKTP
jgi:NitT/TauT family transport system substrate-binding protein